MSKIRNVLVLSIVMYSISQSLSFLSDFDLYRYAKHKMWVKITSAKIIGKKDYIADSIYFNYMGKKDSVVSLVSWEYQFIVLSDSSSVKHDCIKIKNETVLNNKINVGDTIFVLLLDEPCQIARFWQKSSLKSNDIRKDIMTSYELKEYLNKKGEVIIPKESAIQRLINKKK